jgi:hypothetical protein
VEAIFFEKSNAFMSVCRRDPELRANVSNRVFENWLWVRWAQGSNKLAALWMCSDAGANTDIFQGGARNIGWRPSARPDSL